MKALVSILILGAASLSLTAEISDSPVVHEAAHPDAYRLKRGQFDYRDSNHGKQLGTSIITITKNLDNGNFNFAMESRGYNEQRWEAVATPYLAPLSAKLSFGKPSSSPPYFDLVYTPGRVAGLRSRSRSDTAPQSSFEAFIAAGTVDQRIDWATVLASDLRSGRKFQFSVYDPSLGTSPVIAEVGPIEQISVPAGSFRVFKIQYRVQKTTGPEEYTVFATQSLPRVMVREDFPDGTVSELIR